MLLFGVAALSSGCVTPQPLPPEEETPSSTATQAPPHRKKPRPPRGLRLKVEPSDAQVEIDGKDRGSAGSLPTVVHTDAGTHQITLRKGGFVTWRGEVSVGEDVENVEVRLVPASTPSEGG